MTISDSSAIISFRIIKRCQTNKFLPTANVPRSHHLLFSMKHNLLYYRLHMFIDDSFFVVCFFVTVLEQQFKKQEEAISVSTAF